MKKGVLSAVLALLALTLTAQSVAAQDVSEREISRVARAVAASPAFTIPASSFFEQDPDWQRRYDAALARKEAGKKKMLIGVIAAGSGVAMAMAAAQSCGSSSIFDACDDEASLASIGMLADVTGSGIFLWGLIEYMDGTGETGRLDAHRPQTSPRIRFGDHQSVYFALGKESAAMYRVSW